MQQQATILKKKIMAHYGFQGLDRNPLNLEDYGYKSH